LGVGTAACAAWAELPEQRYDLSVEALDRQLERNGFVPLAETVTMERPTGAGGRRVTANAFHGEP
jgi:hypothetical protein